MLGKRQDTGTGNLPDAQRRMTASVRANLDNHFAGKPVVTPVPELRAWAHSPDAPKPK